MNRMVGGTLTHKLAGPMRKPASVVADAGGELAERPGRAGVAGGPTGPAGPGVPSRARRCGDPLVFGVPIVEVLIFAPANWRPGATLRWPSCLR